MKACIYQKQEPVDIPQAETRTLKDVLALPWGFEIYSPADALEPAQPAPPGAAPRQRTKVLVVGMGPAGFTLAHHLMNDGHTVVGIDGLKIEPLPGALSGVTPTAARPFEPVRDVASLYEPLDDRVMAGFGGVAEYGITVRWDKNFLKVIRLLLERRAIRAVRRRALRRHADVEDAIRMGFDHIALCMGRGQADGARHAQRPGPRRAHGVGLPDGAAAHRRGQGRLHRQHAVAPAGGGHRRRPDRHRHGHRIARLLRGAGREVPRALRGAGRRGGEDGGARRLVRRRARDRRGVPRPRPRHRAEHEAATREAAPRASSSCCSWGGATIAYRRRLVDSPSYTLNHEEVEKALEEGIRFAEGLTPARDRRRRLRRRARHRLAQHTDPTEPGTSRGMRFPAGAHDILIAAGTQPNTVLAREDARTSRSTASTSAPRRGRPCRSGRSAGSPSRQHGRVLLTRLADGRFVSFFGDLHPSFSATS
jgi:hypothetical protein